jgi:hypothetical protein
MKSLSLAILFLLVVALALGFTITWIDSRPSWDDTGITALLIFASTFVLGMIRPRLAWMSALAVGLWIPLQGVIRYENYASALALVFAFGGAYVGAFGRGLVAFARRSRTETENKQA